jgi:hypothetical protein
VKCGVIFVCGVMNGGWRRVCVAGRSCDVAGIDYEAGYDGPGRISEMDYGGHMVAGECPRVKPRG